MFDALAFVGYVLSGLALLGLGLAEVAYRIALRLGIYRRRFFWRVTVLELVALQGIVIVALPLMREASDWAVSTQAHVAVAAFVFGAIRSQGVGMVVGGIVGVAALVFYIARNSSAITASPARPRFEPGLDDVIEGR